MSWFQWKEYRRYRHAAKGRHGVHSPAIYHFIEEGLRPPAKHFSNAASYVSATGEAWQPDDLAQRIAYHFRFAEIIIPGESGQQRSFQAIAGDSSQLRLFWWNDLPPARWPEKFHGENSGFDEKDMLAITGIHRSPEHVAAWRALCNQPGVRASIDLFQTGLLLFNKDFKERQHFVLKYPA